MGQGPEFRNAKWAQFFAEEGIIHDFTAPCTHQRVEGETGMSTSLDQVQTGQNENITIPSNTSTLALDQPSMDHPTPHRSARTRNPSRRRRETDEYLQQEKEADRRGGTWATEISRELDHSLASALVAAVREDLSIPQSEPVRPPPGANVVESKWHCVPKFDSEGNITSYESRLVAKGFTQVYGIDYFETFASVVRFDPLRLILAAAASLDLELRL